MKLFLALLLIASPLASFAQTDAPKKEFTMTLSSNALDLKAGESKKLQVYLSKSKSFQRGEATMSLASPLPKGVSVSFDPERGNFDKTEVTLSAANDVKPGIYSLIIKSTLNFKSKGSTLMLTVTGN